MKKIVSNVLIVSTQLVIGALFLFMLFSDSNEDNKVVVVKNDNLNKMADAVSELFIEEKEEMQESSVVEETKEVDLISAEEKKKQEEAKKEEERKKAEEARIKAEEEAKKKAEEEARRNAIVEHASGYISKPAMGFNVTTDNRTYSLSESDFNVVAGVVACEAGGDKNEVLAVISVILNRADNRGMSPLEVVAESGQFTCYKSLGDPSSVASVVTDALNGIRNNSYNSFNNWTNGDGNNYIVEGGNKYK